MERSEQKKIIVYTTKTCPYCTMAKEFLKTNKIKYEEIDVGADRKAAEEMIKKSGQMGVPVLDIGGKIIVGYDKEAIKKALNLH
jgi:glutaredoxin 3